MTNVFNNVSPNGRDSGTPDQEILSEEEALRARYTREDGSLDIDGLIKAKAHADRHIANVEREQAELRSDLQARLPLEDLVSRIEAAKSINPAQQVNAPVIPASEVDIEGRIDAKLSALQKTNLHKQNVAMVQNELTKAWGPDYSSKLKAKARELGESEDDLQVLAQERPKMFLRLMVGEAGRFNDTYSAPSTSVNRTSYSAPNPKGYGAFQKMRNEDPSRYWSTATQREIHKLAMEASERGEDFTKT